MSSEPKTEYTPDQRGLTNKYIVHRTKEDGSQGEVLDGPHFVLRPFDPHARLAMRVYAASVANENARLADDLVRLVEEHGGVDRWAKYDLPELEEMAQTFTVADVNDWLAGIDSGLRVEDDSANGEFRVYWCDYESEVERLHQTYHCTEGWNNQAGTWEGILRSVVFQASAYAIALALRDARLMARGGSVLAEAAYGLCALNGPKFADEVINAPLPKVPLLS